MRTATLGLAIGSAFVSSVSAVQAQLQLQPVLVTGQPAPGLPGIQIDGSSTSHVFGEFNALTGEVLAWGNLQHIPGGSIDDTNDTVTFIGRPGNMRLLTRSGAPIPDSGGLVTPGRVTPSPIGFITHGLDPTWPADNRSATYLLAPDGSLQKLVASGDPAPGMPGVQLTAQTQGLNTHRPSLGVIAPDFWVLSSRVAGPGIDESNDSVRWLGPPGDLKLVAREGQPIPGIPDRSFVQPLAFGFTTSGQMWFGHGQMNTPDRVAVAGTFQQLQIIARHGDPVPGTANIRLSNPSASPTPNGDGHFVSGELINDAGTIVGRGNYLLRPGEALQPIMSTGLAAPGTNAVFGSQSWSFINSGPAGIGQSLDRLVLVSAPLEGPGVTDVNDRAFYIYSTADVPQTPPQLLVREGDAAPLEALLTFAHLHEHEGRSTLRAINDRGDVVFSAFLGGPDGGEANDESLWLRAADGTFTLIAREGDYLPVPGGQPRQIAHLLGPAYQLLLSDAGDELLFTVEFTDATRGLYVVPIPEPTAAAALLLPATLLLTRPRRRSPLRAPAAQRAAPALRASRKI
jgi:hypothetical protein